MIETGYDIDKTLQCSDQSAENACI